MYNLLKGSPVSTKAPYSEDVNYNYIFDLWEDDTFATNGRQTGSYTFEILKRYPTLIDTTLSTYGGSYALKPISKSYTLDQILEFAAQENVLWDTWLTGSASDIATAHFDVDYWKNLPYKGVKKPRYTFDWGYYSYSEMVEIVAQYFHNGLTIPEDMPRNQTALKALVKAEMDRRTDEFTIGV
jgi:hypothetical protein